MRFYIFMISFISPFGIINFAVSDPKIALCIPAPVADATAVNHNETVTLLVNALITFFH